MPATAIGAMRPGKWHCSRVRWKWKTSFRTAACLKNCPKIHFITEHPRSFTEFAMSGRIARIGGIRSTKSRTNLAVLKALPRELATLLPLLGQKKTNGGSMHGSKCQFMRKRNLPITENEQRHQAISRRKASKQKCQQTLSSQADFHHRQLQQEQRFRPPSARSTSNSPQRRRHAAGCKWPVYRKTQVQVLLPVLLLMLLPSLAVRLNDEAITNESVASIQHATSLLRTNQQPSSVAAHNFDTIAFLHGPNNASITSEHEAWAVSVSMELNQTLEERSVIDAHHLRATPSLSVPEPFAAQHGLRLNMQMSNELSESQQLEQWMPLGEPIFDFGMPRNITAHTGQAEAVIKCRVDRLNDKSVSWIRKRDLHILSVATATYTSDKRFEVTASRDEREWTLHVKGPQQRDSGIYECQVNTEPKISMAFQLNVIEISPDARAVIGGPADLHFKAGSAIILNCIVQQPAVAVKYIGPIYWYRGGHMITPFEADDTDSYTAHNADNNYSNNGAGVDEDLSNMDRSWVGRIHKSGLESEGNTFGITTKGGGSGDRANGVTPTISDDTEMPAMGSTNEITLDFKARIAMESQLGDTLKSRLRISNAQTTDTGNYTCQPTTARSASVMVHVINDENPAAMQKSAAGVGAALPAPLLLIASLLDVATALGQQFSGLRAASVNLNAWSRQRIAVRTREMFIIITMTTAVLGAIVVSDVYHNVKKKVPMAATTVAHGALTTRPRRVPFS